MTRIIAPRVGLFGLLGTGNFGNDGSLKAALAHLRAERPDAVVDCFCSGPEYVTAHYGIAAVPLHRWAAYRQERRGPGATALKALGKVVDIGRTLAWVRRHDAVIVPGAGVLEATLPLRPWGFPYALFLLCLSGRLVGTRVALLDVGADVIESRATRGLLRSAARLAHHRSYRDAHSREAMRRMGVDVRGDEVGADLTFALPLEATPRGPTGVVGVGLMAWSGNNVDRHRAEQIRDAYLAVMTAFVGWLVDGGRRVRLFIGDAADDPVVAQVAAAVRAERPDLDPLRIQIEPIRSLDDVERRMRDVDTVVATRYHNILTALRLGKPTLSIGYSAKTDVVMAEMGLAEFRHSAHFPDLEQLIAQFTALEARREALGRVVAAGAATSAERLRRQLDGLYRELLGEHTTPRGPSLRNRERGDDMDGTVIGAGGSADEPTTDAGAR